MSAIPAGLLASDLDGTLIPPVDCAEAASYLERTRTWLTTWQGAGGIVAYVSGRYYGLARRAVTDDGLPPPDWWVCNVGTEIYAGDGTFDRGWYERLGTPLAMDALWANLPALPGLVEQESEKQGPHKLSYYADRPLEPAEREAVRRAARAVREDLILIHSVEEETGRALIDLIPGTAGKAAAVLYLMERMGIDPSTTAFAGDSGNDLDALVSGVGGILVGNASEAVRSELDAWVARRPQARLVTPSGFYGDGVREGLESLGLWPDR